MRYPTRLALAACSIAAAAIATMTACATDLPSAVEPKQLGIAEARGNTDTPVSTYVADSDTGVAPSLQVRSDGLGVYRSSNTLTSIIQPIGAWVLDSQNPRNSTRTLFLDFSQPIAGSGPGGGDPTAVPSALYKVYVIAMCNAYNNSLWALAPGATMECPLHIAFSAGGVNYAVQMNPRPTSADPNGAPETDSATVTCLTPASGPGPCTEWKLTPTGTFVAGDGSLNYRNVARLIKYVSSKNGTTNVSQGDFYFSFAIRLTNP
jgi:hypothetical protein